MLRVRPGVELVRASLVPTSELITLDLPTFDRPRKAISGTEGTGKCATSVAAARNRERTLISKFPTRRRELARSSSSEPPDRLNGPAGHFEQLTPGSDTSPSQRCHSAPFGDFF